MNQATTPLVEVAKIDVEEGFNARTHMDEAALDRLAASLSSAGIVQPLAVRETEDGRVTVIAGHRRLEAAKRAGIEQVPVVIHNGDGPRLASLVENLHREDLDPIDTARGLKALAEELNLETNKEIAEEVDMSAQWVSERLRLLKLPEGVQRHIASGQIPVEAERELRKVAAVSPRVAECVCELAVREKVEGRDFVRDFDQLLEATAERRFEPQPTMVSARSFPLSTVVKDAKAREELAERINATDPYLRSEDPVIRFGEAEVDAARAAGCLIEHQVDQGGFVSTVAFITDAELAADLVERAVQRREKEAKKRAEEDTAWRSRQQQGTPEEQKEQRQTDREQAQRKAAAARGFNEALGRNLLQRRGKKSQKQHGLARAKALAAVLLADNPELPGRGLRLVLSQLQEVEVKQLKSGEPREKVNYAGAPQCLEYLQKRIAEARTEGEVLEVVGDALIAGLTADQAELPQSRRIGWWSGAEEQLKKLLAPDIKAVKPRRAGGNK
jgi:ParB/RepB/Spo0J family partition protein